MMKHLISLLVGLLILAIITLFILSLWAFGGKFGLIMQYISIIFWLFLFAYGFGYIVYSNYLLNKEEKKFLKKWKSF